MEIYNIDLVLSCQEEGGEISSDLPYCCKKLRIYLPSMHRMVYNFIEQDFEGVETPEIQVRC
ncbi:MAG: hypothetical protein HY999_02585 [Nitrospinae bacterium]|nr:hypothetical protein [Nitrospinota bacterium]